MAPTNWRHILPQARRDQASPADVLNPQVRKALMYALDRDQIAEGVFPGTQLRADSIAAPGTPIGDAVATKLVRYPHDLTRAAALLEDAGWRRGTDGMLVKPTGERFQLELRSQGLPEIDKVFALMQQDYRKVGIDLVLLDLPGIQNPVDYALYPGLLITGFPVNFASFGGRWHTRGVARPENRYAGTNSSGYSSPPLDRILDDLDRSIRREDLYRYWADAWQLMSDDVAVMPMYFFPQPNVARKRVLGAIPSNPFGSATWQIHQWDVQ